MDRSFKEFFYKLDLNKEYENIKKQLEEFVDKLKENTQIKKSLNNNKNCLEELNLKKIENELIENCVTRAPEMDISKFKKD